MKIENVKIIFVDIDGTLTNSNQEISEFTKNIFKKAKEAGIIIVICSGRSSSYVKWRSEDANCSNYIISSTGNLVSNYVNEKIIYKSTIDRDDVYQIWDFCQKYQLKCTVHGIKGKYIPYMSKIDEDKTTKIIVNDIRGVNDDFLQLVISDHYVYKFPMVEKYFDLKYKKLMISNKNTFKRGKDYYFIDVINKNSSKSNAILEIINYLNINLDNTMCFGDSMNDLSMFKVCGYPVAMKNADNEIKSYSKYVTDYTNNEDGVAHFIEDYLL